MGCIARNFFGSCMIPYPDEWAQWIKSCCLGILLTRGGLNISFTNKGILVFLMSFFPSFIEATVDALMSLGLFGFPIEVSYTLGYTLASVSPTIIVPILLKWNDLGYGREKGIPSSLIASGTFDNI